MTIPLYLNIGCGKIKLTDFVNIDKELGGDLQCDVTKGLPYKDGSVDGIYSEHFIEHLTQKNIVAFLRECRRVLKPGGRVRIATPDLDELIRQYIENDWGQPWLKQYGYEWIRTRAEYLNISLRDWGHAWVMDQEELSRLAASAGFESIKRCSLNESTDMHLVNLETRNESTLIMECFKRIDLVADDPMVSIIIPAYRSEFFLQCLESALGQTFRNIEIIVLDDSATNDIERIVGEYARHDLRIIYYHNFPPLGEPGSLTRGIQLSRGEFIKPLYDDDLLMPNAIAGLVAIYREIPDARLACGQRILINQVGHAIDFTGRAKPLNSTSGRLRGSSIIESILASGTNSLGEPTCMFFRRKDAITISEPNVMSLFGQLCVGVGDVCLAYHLLSRGDLAYLAEPIAYVRVHAGQAQQQEGFRDAALLSFLYLRQQSLRLGFKVPMRSILINKLLLKYKKLYYLVRAKRRFLSATRSFMASIRPK